jgi:hypothetical protein
MATTTKYWTWADMYVKMCRELDFAGDSTDFVGEIEMREYANDAIDRAEAIIHTLYEDYFLMKDTIALVSGTETYPLPSNIYAHKIRSIIYYNGSDIYQVKQVKTWDKFLTYRYNKYYSSENKDYYYFIVNTTAGTPHIMFTPAAVASGSYIEVWHIRNANRLEAGANICDIPEFAQYVFDWIRERVFAKEAAGSPKHQDAMAKLMKSEKDMSDTLGFMTCDEDPIVEPDMSHYEEHT